jgi:hypothetical protein
MGNTLVAATHGRGVFTVGVSVVGGAIQLSSTTYNVNENGTSATITATRVGGTTGAVGISYATSNGTAAAGSDYTTATGTLSWADGDGADKTFVVPITDDSTYEGNETINLTLSTPTGGAILGAPSTAVLTVVENDPEPFGVIQFSAATYSVNEAGATATITATRTSGSSGAVGVSYATSNGTATAGSDYTTTSGTLSWATGDAASKTFTVPILNDSVFEGANETVNLTLTTPTGGATLGTQTTAVLTIVENDAAGVTVTQSGGTTTVTEGGATDSYTVVLTSQPLASVTITPTANSQLTVLPAPLTFTTADWNVAQTVTVTAVDDTFAEGSHSGSVTHAATSADAAYQGIAIGGVTATITDNDAVGFTVTPTSGLVTTEAGGTATFTVKLNSTPTANVSIGLSSSDTTEGTVLPTTLTFTPANALTAQTVTVTGVDDTIVDGALAYTIVTGAATSTDSGYNGVNAADVAVSNSDNDVAGITVTPTSGLVTSEAGGTATFTVKLNSTPSANVTIGLSTSD